jgi:hypothetical protein
MAAATYPAKVSSRKKWIKIKSHTFLEYKVKRIGQNLESRNRKKI